jgi:hypothetical protein
MAAQRTDGRRRKDDVTDQPQSNEQNPQSRIRSTSLLELRREGRRYGSTVASSSSITGMSSFTG